MSNFDDLFRDNFTTAFAVFSSDVTYVRGGDSFTVSSMDAKTSAETQIAYGAQLIKEAKEFLILKTLLAIDGSEIEPQAGDIIIDAQGSWEVASYPAAPDYETDVTGIHWLIRTIKTYAGS
jgi:hypothetical protein